MLACAGGRLGGWLGLFGRLGGWLGSLGGLGGGWGRSVAWVCGWGSIGGGWMHIFRIYKVVPRRFFFCIFGEGPLN